MNNKLTMPSFGKRLMLVALGLELLGAAWCSYPSLGRGHRLSIGIEIGCCGTLVELHR